jgi:hypothetical protein
MSTIQLQMEGELEAVRLVESYLDDRAWMSQQVRVCLEVHDMFFQPTSSTVSPDGAHTSIQWMMDGNFRDCQIFEKYFDDKLSRARSLTFKVHGRLVMLAPVRSWVDR